MRTRYASRMPTLRVSEPLLVSADDAGEILAVSPEQVDRFVEAKILQPVARTGAVAVFDRDEVARLAARLRGDRPN